MPPDARASPWRHGSSTSTCSPRPTATRRPNSSRCSTPISRRGASRCGACCAKPRSTFATRGRFRATSAIRWSPTSSSEVARLEGRGRTELPGTGRSSRAARERRRRPGNPHRGRTQLQVSWEPGRVVAWAGGPHAPVGTARRGHGDARRGGRAGVGLEPAPAGAAVRRRERRRVRDSGRRRPGLARRGRRRSGSATTSARACAGSGSVAIWAVELTARGAMVPQLRRRTPPQRERQRRPTARTRCAGRPRSSTRRASNAWSTNMPGSVRASSIARSTRARSTRSALTGMVDAICRDGARRHRSARAAAACPHRATTSPKRSSPGSTAARSTRR